MSETFEGSAGTSTAADTTTSGVSDSVSQSEQTTSATVSPTVETSVPDSGEAVTAAEGESTGTAPVAEEAEPDIDFGSNPDAEKARTAFINLRQQLKEQKQQWQQFEPARAIVQERGWENIQKDLTAFDAIWSEDPETRAGFHQALYEESPTAYQRFVGDLITDPVVQQTALESLGLNPEMVDLYRQVTQTGALPQAAAPTDFDPDWLAQIDPQYHDLLKSLDPEIQADYALREPKVANFDLRNVARIQEQENHQRQVEQVQQRLAAERQAAQVEAVKDSAYSGIRDVVKSEVGKLFPDPKLQEILTNSAEAALLRSPKGAQLWNEIEAAIENGEMRTVKRLTPLIVTEATAQVQQELRDFASIYDKARKYDELNRSQANSSDVPPGTGDRLSQNGRYNIPNTSARGQFDPANLFALRDQIFGSPR